MSSINNNQPFFDYNIIAKLTTKELEGGNSLFQKVSSIANIFKQQNLSTSQIKSVTKILENNNLSKIISVLPYFLTGNTDSNGEVERKIKEESRFSYLKISLSDDGIFLSPLDIINLKLHITDYFKGLLNSNLRESQTGELDLKGFSKDDFTRYVILKSKLLSSESDMNDILDEIGNINIRTIVDYIGDDDFIDIFYEKSRIYFGEATKNLRDFWKDERKIQHLLNYAQFMTLSHAYKKDYTIPFKSLFSWELSLLNDEITKQNIHLFFEAIKSYNNVSETSRQITCPMVEFFGEFTKNDCESIIYAVGDNKIGLSIYGFVDDEEFEGLTLLKHLRKLRLDNVKPTKDRFKLIVSLDDVEPAKDYFNVFESLSELEHLSLISMRVYDADLVAIGKLKQLTHLYLNDNYITDKGLIHLQPLTQLEVLNLNKNMITGKGLEDIKSLSKLRELHLWCNQVEEATLENIQYFPCLKKLNIGNNFSITKQVRAKLSEAFPLLDMPPDL